MRTGIYDISNEEYHASEGISRSGISELKKSPLHYWDKYINPKREEQKTSAAMSIGSAVHGLVLEPEKFDQQFAVLEKVDLRTKLGKDYKNNFEILSKGKILLKEEDYMIAQEIAQSILKHPTTIQILSGQYEVEKSIFWQDEETGLICKARPDIWNFSVPVICDIKTTNDASPEAFIYSIKKMNYHIQAAMQIDGIYANTGETVQFFSFIAAPNERPYKPYIYTLTEDTIEQGRREYKDALKVLKKCVENNKWDLDREKIMPVSLPNYSLNTSPFYNLMEIYACQS